LASFEYYALPKRKGTQDNARRRKVVSEMYERPQRRVIYGEIKSDD